MIETLVNTVPLLLRGLVVTIQITISALFIGFIIGLFLATLRVFGGRLLTIVALAYINIIRSIPTIVFVLMFYLILGGALNISPLFSVILALGVHSSAYQAEILRGAYSAVSKEDIKVGQSLGMSNLQIFRKIIFKQLLVYAIPAGSNEITIVLKETSIAFVAGVTELFRQADIVASVTKEYLLMYILAGIIYFLLTFSMNKFFTNMEKRFSRILS